MSVMSPRPYMSAKQLAECTPWTVDTIRQMMRRGKLRKGTHWFQPMGRHSQVVFKWEAIVELLEGPRETVVDLGPTFHSMPLAGALDVEKAATEFERLLS